MKGTAADLLVKYLEQEGVEYVFGVPGSHLLPFYDALYNNGHIKPVLARHESGAAFIAYGYALASGKIGTTAFGKGALQEGSGAGRTISHVRLFDSLTKMSTLEIRGANLPFTLRRALRTAMTGRPGPVHIDLPADVQKEIIEEEILPVASYRPDRSLSLPGLMAYLLFRVENIIMGWIFFFSSILL